MMMMIHAPWTQGANSFREEVTFAYCIIASAAAAAANDLFLAPLSSTDRRLSELQSHCQGYDHAKRQRYAVHIRGLVQMHTRTHLGVGVHQCVLI